jgi:ATP-dependent protease Clp ATPase subunit
LANKTGARGLHSELERTLIPHMFNLRRYASTGIKCVEIDPAQVNKPTALTGTD